MSKNIKIKNKVPKTTVVCLKGQKGQQLEEDQVYVGRKIKLGGWDLPETPYANKYKGRNPVASYYRWLMEPEQEELREQIKVELKGKKLACWCYNSEDKNDEHIHCHADALASVADDKMTESLKEALEEEEDLFSKVKKNKEVFDELLEKIESLSYQDRIIGMFTGIFVGDAKGSLYEFGKKHPKYEDEITERLTSINRYNKEDNITYGLGQVTDDSEMTIILAGHLVDQYELQNKKKSTKSVEKVDAEKLAQLYMDWANSGTSAIGKNTKELFGGVKTLKGFASHYKKKFQFDPPYNEQPELESDSAEQQLSNGSLMRCSVLALLKDNSLIYRDIYLTNPSSIVEQMENDYVNALRMTLNNDSAEDIFKYLTRKKKSRSSEYQSVIDDIKNGVKRTLTNKKTKGEFTEGKGSAMSLMYSVLWSLFYYINGYKIDDKKKKSKDNIGIFDIFKSLIEDFPGSDTDTICVGAGALIGAIIGYKTMAENKDYVYNCNLIFDIEQETDRPRDYNYHPARMYKLFPKLFKMYEEYNE